MRRRDPAMKAPVRFTTQSRSARLLLTQTSPIPKLQKPHMRASLLRTPQKPHMRTQRRLAQRTAVR